MGAVAAVIAVHMVMAGFVWVAWTEDVTDDAEESLKYAQQHVDKIKALIKEKKACARTHTRTHNLPFF